MIPRRALRAAAVVAAGVVLAVGGSASAGTTENGATLQVQSSGLTEDSLSVSFSAQRPTADGLPEVLQLTGDVVVQATPADGGTPVQLDVDTSGAADAANRATIMLVLDTSGSMKDDLFEAEKSAATTFLDKIGQRLRGNVDVGLYTFESKVAEVSPPISDLSQIKTLIGDLKLGDDTALYQAVIDASEALPKSGQRAIVMVTDGANDPFGRELTTEEKQRQDALRRKARAKLADRSNGIGFTGVLLGNARNDLQSIAPDNTVLSDVSPEEVDERLDQVFSTGADKVTRQLRVTADLPEELRGKSLNLVFRAKAADGTLVPGRLSLTATPVARPTPTDQVQALPIASPSLGAALGSPALIGALVAVFLALAALAFMTTGAISAREGAESEISRRLSFYTLRGGSGAAVPVRDEPSNRLGDSRVVRSAINVVNRVARQRKLDDALDARLEAAGLPIRTAEWTLLHLGAAVGGALVLLVAARGMLVGAVLGLVLGLTLPWLFLSLRTSMRERKFLAQLPDTLQLLAGSLAAGYSLPQAMDAVLRESEAPISSEFNRALIETRLGMPPEDALEGIATRTGSQDFAWVVIAIRIQREVGGNLAELLSSVADTLRERERLRRQVTALSAEGRLSGIILGALPLLFALFLIFTKPDYIGPLFNTQLGLLLLGMGVLLLVAGGFWMSRLVKVDV